MREFTKNKELTRSGVTRFATTYLTLQSLHKQKSALRTMFASDKWKESKWAKQPKGRRAKDVVQTYAFWTNVTFTLKVMGPIVRVLRLVDNEKKPAMGYLYEGMERAKITIAKALGENSVDYQVVSAIIDKRWDCQLHHPLHAAGYYFNPEFYCYRPEIEQDQEVTDGMIKCVQRLVPSKDKQDLIMKEMVKWVNQEGRFALDIAKRAHCTIAPAQWWNLYGKEVPNIQQLAIKVLSLTCSSSGCERNWSTFEQIHSKKRNRLEHKRLQDLVFVKYNKTLKNCRDKEVVYDPISLDNIDDCNEWMTGRMEEEWVFEDEDLTWEVVGDASGAGEVRATRSSQPSSSRALVDEDSEKDDLDESEAEYAIDVDGSSDDQFDDGLDD
ncbi:putative HAT dimerization domain, ribonuclease H-like superfamily [Helianthus annuus]|nr:putative HAT dimerization domain, ribonuclease H-like superfamily [Helianthus annuus]